MNVNRAGARRTATAVWSDFCAVAPSPELREGLLQQLAGIRAEDGDLTSQMAIGRTPRLLGLDDGTIFPPDEFPLGTPSETIRSAAADRAPLQGTIRVIVVLADFSDQVMTATVAHFQDLFFSLGVLPHGSVRDYYREVTHGLVDIVGEVVGPLRLPQTLAWYANGNFGIGRPSGTPRANIMAEDTVAAADPLVNFASYDNDGNGFVDAFIVVHAGPGGEATGNPGHIWSHKWTLPAVHNADGTKIFAYLTIPEDAKIGVCAHELGHLLFGFPDLYDTDGTSEGIGNWCLMAGGSWGGGGDVPVHPSAWCKVNQSWASATVVTSGGTLSIPDVKSSNTVHRLWKNGTGGSEYFLIENRQQTGYDVSLPGSGLLIWHIDESQPGNTDENHYKVGLVQADNKRDLELSHNRGDAGDPYPGSTGNTAFTPSSAPDSHSYAGADTCVSITGISTSQAVMTATVAVSCGKNVLKDAKDGHKEFKEIRKELKDNRKEFKEFKEFKEGGKDTGKDVKEPFKEHKDTVEVPEGPGGPGDLVAAVDELRARLAAVEQALGANAPASAVEPFIGPELRPDLTGGPQYGAAYEALRQGVTQGDPQAKRSFDSLPPQ